jgi:hypothetical protein
MSEIPDVTPSDPDASAAPEAEPAASNATPESAWRSRLPVLTIPLSRVQMVVGLAAGLLSISGFLYPALRATRPPLPLGELVTVVHEAKTRRPVVDATVEVLTPGYTLVTTLTPKEEGGRARHVIKEGTYRVRVTHPRFALESRAIRVVAGTIAEVRFHLSPRPAAAGSPVAAPSASPVTAPARAPRPTPAVVSPPKVAPPPSPVVEPPAVERPRTTTGVRRTLLRDEQSP